MITTYNQDCNIGLSEIPDHSIEIILTDPPYKYLKNQKLEVDFDETVFFDHVKRVLKKDGFIVMFGRGTSFYRWNTMLADRGFQFKEEIVWDKVYTSSPVTAIQRCHETASIHTVNGVINRVKIPYLEQRENNLHGIIGDVKRLRSSINNRKELDHIIEYLDTKKKKILKQRDDTDSYSTTVSPNSTGVFSIPASVVSYMVDGLSERSIIDIVHDRYSRIHPTQKPVRLLERLLALVMKNGGGTVLDPFMGSGSTAIAAYNMGLDFIGYEIDKEYFEGAENRIKEHTRQLKLQF